MEIDYETQQKIDEGNARINSWVEHEKQKGKEQEFLALRMWFESIGVRPVKGTLRVPHILRKHYTLQSQYVRVCDGCLIEMVGGRHSDTGRILLSNI